MTWRIGIRHVTGHRYANEVSSSYNEARITPLSTPRQLCLEAKVEVSPSVRPRRYWDYWGTCVDSFDLHLPHTEMVVTGTSVVETATPERPGRGVGWDTLSATQVADLGEKEAVRASQPKAFFTIPHFDGYSAILIQLKTVTKRRLKDAIVDGWLACAPSKLAAEYVKTSKIR